MPLKSSTDNNSKDEENVMKRIIGVILCMALVISMLSPGLSVLAAGGSESGSGAEGSGGMNMMAMADTVGKFYNGIHAAAEECDSETNFGKAFVITLKNIGKSIAGIEDDEDPPIAYQTFDFNMEEINESISGLTATLEEQGILLDDIKTSMAENYNSIAQTLEDIQKQIDDTAEQAKYYSYIESFFSCYNSFRTAVAGYEKNEATLYGSTSEAPEVIKSMNDQFYVLDGYGSENLYAKLTYMSQYLQGTNASMISYSGKGSSSIINVMCEYLKLSGYEDYEIAEIMNDFITQVYYTYMSGCYYYSYLSAYQLAYIEEADSTYYHIELNNTNRAKSTIESNAIDVLETALYSTAVILDDMQSRFVDYTVFAVTYREPVEGFYIERNFNGNCLDVESGSTIYLPDARTALKSVFSEEIVAMADVKYIYEIEGNATADGRKIRIGAGLPDGEIITAKLKMDIPGAESKVINTFTMTVKSSEMDYGCGYGTYDYPFLIHSYIDYNAFAEYCNCHKDEAVYAYQLRNINFGGAEITAIDEFWGEYYGNGCTIENAVINTTAKSDVNNAGIFAILGGRIYDTSFKNIAITVNETANANNINAGIIAGLGTNGGIHRCTVEECTLTTAESKMSGGQINVGGVCGKIEWTEITDCIVKNTTVNAYSHGLDYLIIAAGGIIGRGNGAGSGYANSNKVANCGVINCYICDNELCGNKETDAFGSLAGEIRRTALYDNFVYMEEGASGLFTNVGCAWGTILGHTYESNQVSVRDNWIYNGENANQKLSLGIVCGGWRGFSDTIYYYNNYLGDNALKRTSSIKLADLSSGLKYGYFTDGEKYPVMGAVSQDIETNDADLSPVYGGSFDPIGIRLTISFNNKYAYESKIYSIYTLADNLLPIDINMKKAGEVTAFAYLNRYNEGDSFKVLVDNTKHEHNFIIVGNTPATATEDGEIVYECECGVRYIQKIPAGTIETTGYSVSGSITLNGTNSALKIILCDEDGKTVSEKALTSGTKTYEFTEIKSGKYTLTVSAERYVTAKYTLTVEDKNVEINATLYLKADVNGDKRVNAKDLMALKQYLANKYPAGQTFISESAEMTGDKRLNARDVTALKQYMAGR